ncbi:hypothetical protein ACNO5E_13385 [Vibrio parahaemolyticus]
MSIWLNSDEILGKQLMVYSSKKTSAEQNQKPLESKESNVICLSAARIKLSRKTNDQ